MQTTFEIIGIGLKVGEIYSVASQLKQKFTDGKILTDIEKINIYVKRVFCVLQTIEVSFSSAQLMVPEKKMSELTTLCFNSSASQVKLTLSFLTGLNAIAITLTDYLVELELANSRLLSEEEKTALIASGIFCLSQTIKIGFSLAQILGLEKVSVMTQSIGLNSAQVQCVLSIITDCAAINKTMKDKQAKGLPFSEGPEDFLLITSKLTSLAMQVFNLLLCPEIEK